MQVLERAVQFKHIEQRGGRGDAPCSGLQSGRRRDLCIGCNEDFAHPLCPCARRAGLARPVGKPWRGQFHSRMADPAEGSQQVGHVAQRTALGAPFVEALARVARHADDDEVVAADQHVFQAQVAMQPCLQARGGGVAGTFDACQQAWQRLDDARRQRLFPGAQAGALLRQQRHRGRAGGLRVADPVLKVAGADRLGVEVRRPGLARQRAVQFRDPARQRLHPFDRNLGHCRG